MPDATANDMFDPANKVSGSPFAKFEKIGDRVVGTYVHKEIRPNKLSENGDKQEVYTLVQDDGTDIFVAGRMKVDHDGEVVTILGGLRKLEYGAYVGIEFVKELPPKKPGHKPTKILEVFHKGVMKKDVYEKWAGVAATKPAEEPDFTK